MTKVTLSLMRLVRAHTRSMGRRWTRGAVAFLGATFAVCLSNSAQADAWQTFQARCLDAFEAFSPAVVTDLPWVKHAELSGSFSHDAVAYGPTEEGHVVIVDPAPLADGDRLCAVAGEIEDRRAIAAWVVDQVQAGRYEMFRNGSATILLSLEWIEPRLQITLVLEGTHSGSYSILETDLES